MAKSSMMKEKSATCTTYSRELMTTKSMHTGQGAKAQEGEGIPQDIKAKGFIRECPSTYTTRAGAFKPSNPNTQPQTLVSQSNQRPYKSAVTSVTYHTPIRAQAHPDPSGPALGGSRTPRASRAQTQHMAGNCASARGRCWGEIPSVATHVVVVAVIGGARGKGPLPLPSPLPLVVHARPAGAECPLQPMSLSSGVHVAMGGPVAEAREANVRKGEGRTYRLHSNSAWTTEKGEGREANSLSVGGRKQARLGVVVGEVV
ncbi:hypothetical protein EDB83DRAFT_2310563 [Lactarius deliciosus]|nr:hypothetical protein EDB83DRAFT_2310563 [Lactarius deliciosus]